MRGVKAAHPVLEIHVSYRDTRIVKVRAGSALDGDSVDGNGKFLVEDAIIDALGIASQAGPLGKKIGRASCRERV